jgi:hypothetical protein
MVCAGLSVCRDNPAKAPSGAALLSLYWIVNERAAFVLPVSAAESPGCAAASDAVQGAFMGKVMHVSKVKVHKEPGNSKIKRIQIEGWPEITRMGVHGGRCLRRSIIWSRRSAAA